MGSSSTTYLISGTTRGIGRGLVTVLLKRPNTIIFAGVRDLFASTAKSLLDLPKASSSEIFLVQLRADDPKDAQKAVETIQKDHGISALDVVIANAGTQPEIGNKYCNDISSEGLLTCFETNTIGPIRLFQAALPLLKSTATSGKTPRFILTASSGGSVSLAHIWPVPLVGYGVSKAAVNWFFKKASGEYKDICILMMHPGFVKTDMAAPWLEIEGMQEKLEEVKVEALEVEDCVEGYLRVVDEVKLEDGNGRFLNWKGEDVPY